MKIIEHTYIEIIEPTIQTRESPGQRDESGRGAIDRAWPWPCFPWPWPWPCPCLHPPTHPSEQPCSGVKAALPRAGGACAARRVRVDREGRADDANLIDDVGWVMGRRGEVRSGNFGFCTFFCVISLKCPGVGVQKELSFRAFVWLFCWMLEYTN